MEAAERLPGEAPALRIGLLLGSQLFNDALASVLSDRGIEAVPLARGISRAIDDHGSLRAVVTDRPGDDAITRVSERNPELPIVVVTDRRAFASPPATTVRWVPTAVTISELVETLGRVCDGRRPSRARPSRPAPRVAAACEPLDYLTDREHEVLKFLADGSTPADISDHLGISRDTVRTHLQNVLTKLGVRSRVEAVAVLRRRAAPVTSASAAPRHEQRPDVVLVAEPTLFRDTLVTALAGKSSLDVRALGSLADLQHVPDDPSTLVVIDESVAGGAISACRLLKGGGRSHRVLICTAAADRSTLLAAVEAGADGYVTAAMSLGELCDAIQRASAGEAQIPAGMLGVLLRDLIDRRREEDEVVARFSKLSKRERAVLALLVEGHDHDDIADRLVLSPHTARTHLQNVLRKLGVHSRLEAVALVTRHNLGERFALNSEAS